MFTVEKSFVRFAHVQKNLKIKYIFVISSQVATMVRPLLKHPTTWSGHRHNGQNNDTQHNDTQHNDTQHNDTQHNDTQHNDTAQ